MAIVERTIMYWPINHDEFPVTVIYDDEIIDVRSMHFQKGDLANDNGRTLITFINGYSVDERNANIVFKRTGRADYVVDNILMNQYINNVKEISIGNIVEFAINLTVTGVDTLEIDLTGANFKTVPAEPEPEPDPEPEPEPDPDPDPEPEPEPEPDPEPELITVSFRTLDNRVNVLNEQGEFVGDSYDIPKGKDYTFRLSPDSNTIIHVPFNIDFGYNTDTGEYDVIPLQDDLTFTVNFIKNRSGNFAGLPLTVKPQPDVEQIPFVKLYNVEVNELEQLSKYRFTELYKDPDPSGIGNIIFVNQQDQDLARFIMSLYKYPFKIENTEYTQILVGNELTDIFAGSVNTQFYEINYGDIHISKTVWGGVSFKNVTVELFVPFFNKITLDVDEVLDNTLQLKLNVNLFNGKGTLIVKSKKTGMVIHSENQQIGQYIPYVMGDTIKSEIGTDILQNDVINPYVEVKKHIPTNTKELQPLSTTKLDYRMYHIQSENVVLNVRATNQEKDEISKLLSKGVIVRGNI